MSEGMSSSEERALLIDSSFTSRRELLATLRESELFAEVVEAESVAHGYFILDRGESDACLLGPSLKQKVAVEFIRRGNAVPLPRPCAFIAVRTDTDDIDAFRDVGATALLRPPWQRTTFRDIVTRAIARARSGEVGELLVNPEGEAAEPSPLVRPERRLGPVLQSLAGDLRAVAEDVAKGKLKVSGNGRPSLATRDAIRLAFERAHPNQDAARAIGSFEHHFVSCLVDWFAERLNAPSKSATENLRQRLLTHPSKR